MTKNPQISCTGPAVTSLATARIGVRPSSGSGAALAIGGLVAPTTDGPVLPIALVVLAVVVVVAAAIVVAIARRRLTRGPSAETGETETTRSGALEALAGRDRNLPRWLDPSIAAARFKTDTATAVRSASAAMAVSERQPVVFAEPIDDLTDRMQVRYDGVPLLDRPDDVLGRTVAEMDGGDEVEVLERTEIWARVRTPNGASGWLPTMTIATLTVTVADPGVDEADPEVPEPAPAVEAPPALEAILEAIVAQRRVHPGGIAIVEPDRPAAPVAATEAVTAKRTRTRKPKAETATETPPEPGTPVDRVDPVVAAGPKRVPAATKRPRPRAATGERRATRPR